jgi:predicted transcriptional regulator
MYETILEALAKKPLTIDRIAYTADVDCTVVSKYIDFLLENGLVEKRMHRTKLLYAVTKRGLTVFRTLDRQRCLERISDTLKQLDKTMQTMLDVSESNKERSKRNEKY